MGPEVVDRIYADGKAVLPEASLLVNQFVVLKAGPSHSALGQVVQAEPEVVAVRVPGSRRAFGIESKNLRQAFALDLLLNPEIPAVSVMGPPGTGKTFLALAAGLEQVLEAGRYRKVSGVPAAHRGGPPGGRLPARGPRREAGSLDGRHPRQPLRPVRRRGAGSRHHALEELLERGELEMAAITYLRGRSITGEFVIIDEAQNLELPTLKVILTRIGADAKVVLCGDFTQVDNPYVSPFGGTAALIEKLKGHALFGHVTLERTVRSPLAEMAANLL